MQRSLFVAAVAGSAVGCAGLDFSKPIPWQDKTAKEIVDNKKESAAHAFAAALKVTPEVAFKLVNAGMNSVEVIATGSEPQDIADVLAIDLEAATAIHNAAKQEYEKHMASTQ